MTISWSGHRGLRWLGEHGRGAMAAQGRIRNGNTGVVGNSVKGLNDSDKCKALPRLFLRNCCLTGEESCSECLSSSACWNALLWKAEYSQGSVKQLASSRAGLSQGGTWCSECCAMRIILASMCCFVFRASLSFGLMLIKMSWAIGVLSRSFTVYKKRELLT